MILESYDSFEYVLDTAFVLMCGGKGLFENTDIVDEGGTLAKVESLYQGPVLWDADVRADSLVNLACFAKEGTAEFVREGVRRFGLLGLSGCVRLVTRSDGGRSDVTMTCSFEGLLETLA